VRTEELGKFKKIALSGIEPEIFQFNHHATACPRFVTIVYRYNDHNFGHYPKSFHLKQRFGNWILSPSSGGTYSLGPNR
jgi:hypothetical protein